MGHPLTPGCGSVHSTDSKTFASILTLTLIALFPTFGEIPNIKYLDGKWGGGVEGGVITRRGINKGYEYAKDPIHQK